MSRNPFWISKRGIAVDAGIILYGIIICLASIEDSLLLWALSIVGSIAIIALLRLPIKGPASSGPRINSWPHQAQSPVRSNSSVPPPMPNEELNPKGERSLPATLNLHTEIDVDAMDWFNDWGRKHQHNVTPAEKTLES